MSYHAHPDARNRQNILQDIQQQKQQLLQQQNNNNNSNNAVTSSAAGPSSSSTLQQATPPRAPLRPTPEPAHTATPTRRTAIEYANTSCAGYFLTQDSAHGNPILPVIPRVDDT